MHVQMYVDELLLSIKTEWSGTFYKIGVLFRLFSSIPYYYLSLVLPLKFSKF